MSVKLAKKLITRYCVEMKGVDSRQYIEEEGLTITGEDKLYYEVNLPEGWTTQALGFSTYFADEKGNIRLRNTTIRGPGLFIYEHP